MTKKKELINRILPDVMAYLKAEKEAEYIKKELDIYSNPSIHCIDENNLDEFYKKGVSQWK